MDKGINYIISIKKGKNKLPYEADRKSYPILQTKALSLGEIKGPAQEPQPRQGAVCGEEGGRVRPGTGGCKQQPGQGSPAGSALPSPK